MDSDFRGGSHFDSNTHRTGIDWNCDGKVSSFDNMFSMHAMQLLSGQDSCGQQGQTTRSRRRGKKRSSLLTEHPLTDEELHAGARDYWVQKEKEEREIEEILRRASQGRTPQEPPLQEQTPQEPAPQEQALQSRQQLLQDDREPHGLKAFFLNHPFLSGLAIGVILSIPYAIIKLS